MRKLRGLTRVDAVVALACIALVLAQAGIINAGGRERSKKEVCLANLRMLTSAWKAYADDNAGKIVNGAASTSGSACPPGINCPAGTNCAAAQPSSEPWYTMHHNELPWIGFAIVSGSAGFIPADICCQKCAVNTGALWKYTGDYNIYQCPVGKKDALITYSIIDSMNGKYKWNRTPGTDNTPTMMPKNTSQIKGASGRIVFIDEGTPSPDSYAVYSGAESWFDLPPVQHEGGTCVSFADGHSVYHKWKAKETISLGKGGIYNAHPITCDGKNDLYWVQIGCWGELLYAPSCPVNLE